MAITLINSKVITQQVAGTYSDIIIGRDGNLLVENGAAVRLDGTGAEAVVRGTVVSNSDGVQTKDIYGSGGVTPIDVLAATVTVTDGGYLGGNTAINLTDLTFVLKFTPALQSGPSAADVTHFNVTLNGAATSAPTLLGTSVEGTNNFQIYAWTWTGVNLTPGGAFTFAATSGGGHVSLDAIQIVPEPSAAALGALAGAMPLTRRRRR